ncbi:hypothetical protein [Rhodococcus baikonurensis]|uniref:Uncharacterized protein n=1 Tax=Rhodococcus baikonurensis TaxID=172041 RepID=A0ABV5XBW2_9NOCA
MSGAGAISVADPAATNFVGLEGPTPSAAKRTPKETLLFVRAEAARWRERNTRRPVPCVSTLPGHTYLVNMPDGSEEAVERVLGRFAGRPRQRPDRP